MEKNKFLQYLLPMFWNSLFNGVPIQVFCFIFFTDYRVSLSAFAISGTPFESLPVLFGSTRIGNFLSAVFASLALTHMAMNVITYTSFMILVCGTLPEAMKQLK